MGFMDGLGGIMAGGDSGMPDLDMNRINQEIMKLMDPETAAAGQSMKQPPEPAGGSVWMKMIPGMVESMAAGARGENFWEGFALGDAAIKQQNQQMWERQQQEKELAMRQRLIDAQRAQALMGIIETSQRMKYMPQEMQDKHAQAQMQIAQGYEAINYEPIYKGEYSEEGAATVLNNVKSNGDNAVDLGWTTGPNEIIGWRRNPNAFASEGSIVQTVDPETGKVTATTNYSGRPIDTYVGAIHDEEKKHLDWHERVLERKTQLQVAGIHAGATVKAAEIASGRADDKRKDALTNSMIEQTYKDYSKAKSDVDNIQRAMNNPQYSIMVADKPAAGAVDANGKPMMVHDPSTGKDRPMTNREYDQQRLVTARANMDALEKQGQYIRKLSTGWLPDPKTPVFGGKGRVVGPDPEGEPFTVIVRMVNGSYIRANLLTGSNNMYTGTIPDSAKHIVVPNPNASQQQLEGPASFGGIPGVQGLPNSIQGPEKIGPFQDWLNAWNGKYEKK